MSCCEKNCLRSHSHWMSISLIGENIICTIYIYSLDYNVVRLFIIDSYELFVFGLKATIWMEL